MSEFEIRMVSGLPWLLARRAVAMTGLAGMKWRTLSDVNRAAVGRTAGAAVVAAGLLGVRKSYA